MINTVQSDKPVPTEVESDDENPFVNLIFNIVLPVFILNQGTKRLGPNGALIALLLALALPIGYGAYDFVKRKKKNYLSLLGTLNILVTGGLAVLKIGGIWFAVKEAFFPLLIGIAVYLSNFFHKPVLKTLFWNKKIFRIEKITSVLQVNKRESDLESLFKSQTYVFAASFLLSALLNFILAVRIFIPLDGEPSEIAKTEALNQQIAQMTWQGYIMIALPMMAIMGYILWRLVTGIKRLTGFSTEEVLATEDERI